MWMDQWAIEIPDSGSMCESVAYDSDCDDGFTRFISDKSEGMGNVGFRLVGTKKTGPGKFFVPEFFIKVIWKS
jgi:hypothetical protein